MASDPFLDKNNCDRCKGDFSKGRIMSWINEEAICSSCKDEERKLISKAVKCGQNISEGMGISFEKLKDLAEIHNN